MLRIEYTNTQDKYFFLYVTDEVRISSTDTLTFTVEYRDGSTVEIHNIWSYLNTSKDVLFELRVLT